MSWRLKLAVTLADEYTTTKDIVLWEVRIRSLHCLLFISYSECCKTTAWRLGSAFFRCSRCRARSMHSAHWYDSNLQVSSSAQRRPSLVTTSITSINRLSLNSFQMPRITCLGVQLDSQQEFYHDDVEAEDEEREHEVETPPPLQPLFQPASNKTSPPAVSTKRSTSARKNDNDIILMADPIPAAPAPPHASSRQFKPTIAVQTQQQVRGATKTPAKKAKTAK